MLVNDIFGGDRYVQRHKPLWEHDLEVGFYYDFVKAGVDRIVKSLSRDLRDHPVTALGVTPGWLRSEQMLDNVGVTEERWRDAVETQPGFAISESPSYLGRGVAALAAEPDLTPYAGRVLTSYDLAVDYDLTDIDGSRPDAWGYIDRYGIEQDGSGVEEFR
ncbi:MAG: hypothetical protein ABI873_10635 [Marmoricola sp.]